MSDNIFESIPRVLQRQIDAAFTQTYNDHFSPNDKHIPSTSVVSGGFFPPSPPGGGGFLPPSPPTGGGFLINDDDDEPTHLPLRLVPHALQLLGLPPDDSEVLGVLANAASGWQSPNVHPSTALPNDTDSDEQWVARADWRAVCAVLLEGGEEEGPRSSSPGRSSPGGAPDVDMSSLSGLSADDASSDEYRLAPSPKSKSKSRAKGKVRTSSSPPPTRRTRRGALPSTTAGSTTPTARQMSTALDAFALFFPELTADDPALPTSRIRVAELQRAAGVLREKIKAEEVRTNVVMGCTN